MSSSPIITEGFGIFGTIEDIITQGFVPGIGLEAEEGIALAAVRPPSVDFVFSSGWYHRLIPPLGVSVNLDRQRPVKTDNSDIKEMLELYLLDGKQPVKNDGSELKEMMELYSRWKAAA